ncbi:hypothetical protein GGH12_001643 [Coemansia sp. RSA 1822]|nr:hypothetical protein LPJ76_001743 [Coemansia sp. RSA 638]KAJ2122511.1 hypothetical protein IW147_003379 [Coemansia sp. RSA 720]KAJ2538359.1 hypothetical protein GGF49_005965 [Coemansia sp. RSA 1853]KAJ2565102.1 hypothetical protein GGH12_001643 [Coemansia sp. RSA 1822]
MSPSDIGDQPGRLPRNAQRPMSVASNDSHSLDSARRMSQATELLGSGSPPIGTSYVYAVAGSIVETDDGLATGSDMVLPEAVAARRLRRHLVTRRPRSGADMQARSYSSTGPGQDSTRPRHDSTGLGSPGFSDGESAYTDEANDEAETDEVPVDPFTLASGDITHHLYRWQEEHGETGHRDSTRRRRTRTHSFSAVASDSEWDVYTPNQIRAPGGFRRQFVRDRAERQGREANIVTANFVDFIGLYGHFAGGDYPSDEDDEDDESAESQFIAASERTRLLAARKQSRDLKATASPRKAFFLLVKAFVGTGVLVLPRAFFNGGLLFSSILMSAIAWYALHCMIMLSDVYLKVGGSYGDLALKLYGKPLKYCVMVSIVLAQLGFCCAYVIFVATNMQDLWNTLTDCKRQLSTETWILIQLLIYIPLSFVRKIKKFASLSVVGNLFILIGLSYLFFYDFWSIVTKGPGEIVQFNPSKFPLLVGTAAFSYEGISLVIPIVESMERKDKFNTVLTASLVICAGLFVFIGALSYLAFGDKVETVILLNLPNGSAWTLGVQFLYSLAIIMSVPLQLFPAIRIIESGMFSRSGKGNPVVKWQKNLFRTLLVVFVIMVAIFGAEELDNFIAIVGAGACLPLSFLYPVMLHYRALADSWYVRLKDLVLSAVALFGLVYVTFISIETWGTSAPPLDRCASLP